MTLGGAVPIHVELIPPAARNEWLALAEVLAHSGPVPCREGDAEAWWPDRKQLDGPATRGAIAGCRRCPAETACLSYALAADERFGVWGGTLPDDRSAMQRAGKLGIYLSVPS